MKTVFSVMASVAVLGASLMAQGQTAPRQAPPDKKPMACGESGG